MEPAAADRDVVAAAPAGVVSDAPPSNRASDSCIGTNESFQFLAKHIDSLELSYSGYLRPSSFKQLESLKALAQSRAALDQAAAQLMVADRCFAVCDKGAGRFRFKLEDNCFFIRLAQASAGGLPVAYCQIRSHYLCHVGAEVATAELRSVLEALAEIESDETVSRIDLAVDFVSSLNMEAWTRQAWVSRVSYRQAHSVGQRFTGWTVGRNCPLSLRMYDKSFEVETQSKKYYLHEIWDAAGWAPWDDVWRIEGQFRRGCLRSFGLGNLASVLGALPGLWMHLLDSIRLTVPNVLDETRGRWPTHPLWESLARVPWQGSQSHLTRIPAASGAPSEAYIGRQVAALLTSVMAREALLEPGSGFDVLRRLGRDHLEMKARIAGISLDELIEEQVRLKGRKFHTMRNASGAPVPPVAESPAARAYRQASDGV